VKSRTQSSPPEQHHQPDVYRDLWLNWTQAPLPEKRESFSNQCHDGPTLQPAVVRIDTDYCFGQNVLQTSSFGRSH
jgi:hypothetical protein